MQQLSHSAKIALAAPDRCSEHRTAASYEREMERYRRAKLQLREIIALDESLLRQKDETIQNQALLSGESDHRLLNDLQMIVSLLSLQSRTVSTPEAADQLTIAARRVAAFGRVHRRLHLLDHQDHVEFKEYLEHLCEDLSGLLFQKETGHAIVVEAVSVEIPTVFAIPLGFIVNELITNSAKYSDGSITVRFEKTSPGSHSLSVSDDGPGLPAGFDPGDSKGLGMKIVLALVKQIGGELHTSSGNGGSGARFMVTF